VRGAGTRGGAGDRAQRGAVAIGFALAAATVAVYAQTLHFEFVDYDDMDYVTENPQVLRGLTAEGVAWAFTSGFASNWFPLTWLSLMLDAELYGADPAGFHATNVALHVLDTLLLFGVLRAMTRQTGPSAAVAALFALHPLHVESVAWVSERKDVLSTAFGLLALGAWTRYAKGGRRRDYAAAAGLLALGLMAKPMLVTLPFVFLLLDYWPLGRLRERRDLPRRLVEKAPLLALSAASSLVTFAVQARSGAVATTASVPLAIRVANAPVSAVRYLAKAVWPADLAVFYPYPNVPELGGPTLTEWHVAGALALLLAITGAVLASKRPWAVVGWLWYLGMLVPVIGLVQVGRQAMADRYTYLPLVGVFIAVAWAGAEGLGRLRRRRPRLAAVAVAAAGLCGIGLAARSASQVRVWRDSFTLFGHALALNPRDATTHLHLANALGARGRLGEAVVHYEAALARHPRYAEAHAGLALARQLQGDAAAAIAHYREALALGLERADLHFRLGNALRSRGDWEAAIAHYRRATELDPAHVEAQFNLHLAERRAERAREGRTKTPRP
jgi:hypothetical protein